MSTQQRGMTPERIREAGRHLRELREKQKITQQEMEKLTAERFGWENRVYAQQVSRIEKGQFDKPPIIDLLRIGGILGLSADDIADMYELWPPQKKRELALDPRLRAAINLANELPLDDREKFLNWIEFATIQAKAEQRAESQKPAAPTRPRSARTR